MNPLPTELLPLQRAQQMAQRMVARTRLLRGLRLLTILLIAELLLDAVYPLPPVVRLAWLALGASLLLYLLRQFVRRAPLDHAALQAAAERVQTTLALRHDELRNPVHFAAEAQPHDSALRRQLQQRAVKRGGELLARHRAALRPARLPALDQMVLLGASLGVLALLTAAQPRLVTVGLARLIDPWADIAPFGLTQVQVRWSPSTPLLGEDVTLTVQTTGQRPAWVEMVEFGPDGRRWRLDEIRAGWFSRQLTQLDSPVGFRIETPHGRSAWLTIEPGFPQPAEVNPSRAWEPTADELTRAANSPVTDRAARRQVEDRLRQLLQAAQQGAQAPASADINSLSAARREALDALTGAGSGDAPPGSPGTPGFPGSAASDGGGPWALSQTTPEPEQREGLAGVAQTARWARHLAEAAAHDLRAWRQGAGSGGAGALARQPGAEASAPLVTPTPRGAPRQETVAAEREQGQTELPMTELPAHYRQLIGAYFQALAREE